MHFSCRTLMRLGSVASAALGSDRETHRRLSEEVSNLSACNLCDSLVMCGEFLVRRVQGQNSKNFSTSL